MITQSYRINLIPGNYPEHVNVSQYDVGSRKLIFTVYDGAVLYAIPSGCVVTIRGRKPDNTAFIYECTYSGSEVSVDVQEQMTVLAGRIPCEIRIQKDGKILGSANFTLNIEAGPVNESTPVSETDIPLLEEAIQAAVTAKEEADRAETEADRAEEAAYMQMVPFLLDGTIETYRDVMARWFEINHVGMMTPIGITGLVDKWYEITRKKWSGGTRFNQPSQSSVSTGTKFGDNIGLTCIPSTNANANTDDYKGLPLFAITLCNFEYDNTYKRPLITAIKDITDNFELDNPDKLVGVLQQSGYKFFDDDTLTYDIGISAFYEEGHDKCVPYPEAVEKSSVIDKVVREWVLHAKYMSHTVNNKLTSYSGAVPTAYDISQNTLVDRKNSMANGLCGGCLCDIAFLQTMFFVKYGQLTADGLLQGCCNYNYQNCVALGESNVKRVLLTAAQANNYIVGSTILIGTYNGSNKDRNSAVNYNLSGKHGAIILSKETVTVSGTSYVALNLDLESTITTVGDGTEASGNTLISTFHWKNGSCDNVKGNDGSPASPTTGQYPAMIQGIEYMMGGWEVLSDVIMYLDGTDYHCYLCDDVDLLSKSSYADYTDIGITSPQPASNSWNYIRKLEMADCGVYFPTDTTGGSSSTYLRDGFYKNAAGNTGTREWLAFGALTYGTGLAGLSAVNGTAGLSGASWNIVARLSCNGNRGEWTA